MTGSDPGKQANGGGRISKHGFVRPVMAGSAVVLGICGLAALFLPGEIGAFFHLRADSDVVMQLAAAGFLALATLNWMGRGAIYGGIFGRPIVFANLMFGTVASLRLFAVLLGGAAHPRLWPVAILLALHALAFGYLLRSPPYGGPSSSPEA